MGWFGSLESPVSGQMVLRVEFAAQGTVKNTLDEGSSGRLWYMGATTLLTTTHDTLDEAMQSLTNAGIDVVRRTVPSLRFGGLQVQPDASGDTTELVVSGDVTYLRSEWDGYKQKLARRWANVSFRGADPASSARDRSVPRVIQRRRHRVEVVVEQVGVDIQGHRRGRVSQHPLHRLHVRSGADRE